MSTSSTQLNLDKLRHIVQKFDASSFTAAVIAQEYGQDTPSEEDVALIAQILQRHAPVLGIQPVTAPGNATPTVWRCI